MRRVVPTAIADTRVNMDWVKTYISQFAQVRQELRELLVRMCRRSRRLLVPGFIEPK